MHLAIRSGLAALAAITLATGAEAQGGRQAAEPSSVCRPDFPPELAAWPDRVASAAAADKAGLPGAQIVVGQAVDAQLRPTPEVRYVLRPEKPGGSVSFGGLYIFTVKQPGRYRIALGSAAWIDVVRDGQALVSMAHGRGPDCTRIRKVVDFSLVPGRYVLQISANGSATMPLLAARLP